MGELSVKNLISIHDLTTEDINKIFQKSLDLKDKLKKGKDHKELEGKTLAMVFEKRSTRTRISFEVGMTQLGGHAIFLSREDTHIGKGEPIKDFAGVVSGYCNGIMARTYEHSTVTELAKYADIPVINGLTNFNHPCQIVADFLTIKEHRGTFDDMKVAWLGDGNNVCHSFMYMCAKLGVDLTIATPEDYKPSETVFDDIKKYAKSDIFWTINAREAAEDADIVVTDTWISMGDPEYKDEESRKKKIEKFSPYQVNADLVAHAKKDYYFMHCLPAYRDFEVTPEVIDGPRSLIYPEAHNRLHAQKGVMALLMK
ncbi:MAG: ornithine carbamoyltransferase [Theionarchaea archaeon DG-70]|nr:MAG: ornithine carbamoyltransferase [Theionarchaea archaeon DG-70]